MSKAPQRQWTYRSECGGNKNQPRVCKLGDAETGVATTEADALWRLALYALWWWGPKLGSLTLSNLVNRRIKSVIESAIKAEKAGE